ncbi:hypothetical protein Fot_35541 [Forsythia ovata]|uniref:Uncharacterized protein n=1 Tax=Forsythia ovata TaxID=205694 RepID=A0ABD1SLV1_9LAMI
MSDRKLQVIVVRSSKCTTKVDFELYFRIDIGQLRQLAKNSQCWRAISDFWRSAPHSHQRRCEAYGTRRPFEPCEVLIFYVSTWDRYWWRYHAVMTVQFPSVPKLKIRREGGGGEGRKRVVDDILPSSPVPFAVPVLGATVLQTPEAMVDNSSFISPTLAMTSEVPSTSFLMGPAPSAKSSRQSGKRKAETDSREGAFQTLVSPPVERINIEFRQDELDPTVLEKLPTSAAIAAASVHKYWTSTFRKAVDNVKLTELLKLAEMYTSRSHLLNCELYKVLAMKVDELHSTVGRDEDLDALRSENKDIRE